MSRITPVLWQIVNFPSNNFARTISTILGTCHPHAIWNYASWTHPASMACTQMFIMCGIAIAVDETSIFICDQTLHLLATSVGLRLLSCISQSPFFLFQTEEPAKAGTCAHDRCALQQLALNVHVKHSDLTVWPKRKLPFAPVCLPRHWAAYWYLKWPSMCSAETFSCLSG